MEGVVIAAVAVIYGMVTLAQRIGWLPQGSTTAAAQARADAAEKELAAALVRVAKLEQQHSLLPVLEALEANARMQSETLEKLASFNGSLHRINRGLDETNEALAITKRGLDDAVKAMQFVAGFAASEQIPTRARRKKTPS